ncbi:MAG: single-stranded-DNA-specific exonuclease RecJ [Treponema sp.]|uniref:single-stranded-DNA-specific exonuclease RecJ n=1 Tax=Treponema sp. TaxID=166 RepID=UPI0025CBB26B|nr:single-stranded-DNA-specific exonuclease RecJ [Treponema sp.]MBR0495124.1 single-stranded-DNA-specific exonuclease RecJ [Treponema sp.]
MKNWIKKRITREDVSALYDKFGVNALTASILARRGITEGADVQFFLEDDLRFMHNPFLFANMEDAVDRILQAKDEGENVLIFGDRDVDGITSTAVLYDCLTSMGINVSWRLPGGTDPYGLNKNAVDDFEKNFGSLVITVDCGISNVEEIAYATEKGMDVIVIDHHTPPEVLPSPAIIVNPKCEDSGYPFKDISGCAVVYKVVSALRFAASGLYKNEVALLAATASPNGDECTIEVLKLQNLVEKGSLSITVRAGTSISDTKLVDFLRGQQIFVWDEKSTSSLLSQIFGSGAEFNFMDLRGEVAKVFPAMGGASLSQLKSKSKLARYNPDQNTEIKGFYNIFVTFVNAQISKQFPSYAKANERDLQLVALAALADIMPLKNENRIFIRHGIASMNKGNAREGLRELLSMQGLLGKRINATDLSWNINPALNATGRLGHPEIGLELFLEKDAGKRTEIAQKIIEMNNERKALGNEGWNFAALQAKQSIQKYGGKLCVIIDDSGEQKINRGVSGTIAGKLVNIYDIPSMAITIVDENAIGSMRSCRGFEVLSLLDKMADLFVSYGGHAYAAGFTFKKERLPEFLAALDRFAPEIELSNSEAEQINIDAEIPSDYLKPDLLAIVDDFEPYGEENRELTFMSKNLRICDAAVIGKTERQHLKLTFDLGKTKWPAMFWGGAESLHRDFDKGDSVDVLYQVGRNCFNGVETPQLIITDIRKSL